MYNLIYNNRSGYILQLSPQNRNFGLTLPSIYSSYLFLFYLLFHILVHLFIEQKHDKYKYQLYQKSENLCWGMLLWMEGEIKCSHSIHDENGGYSIF